MGILEVNEELIRQAIICKYLLFFLGLACYVGCFGAYRFRSSHSVKWRRCLLFFQTVLAWVGCLFWMLAGPSLFVYYALKLDHPGKFLERLCVVLGSPLIVGYNLETVGAVLIGPILFFGAPCLTLLCIAWMCSGASVPSKAKPDDAEKTQDKKDDGA